MDASPPYPIQTGTVPGAVSDGTAQDSIYLFAGAGAGSLVAKFYTADPADGDPYINTSKDRNYDLQTDVLLNSGSVAVSTLGMDAVNVEAGPYYPVLDIEGATLHVTGSLVGTIPISDYPAGLGTVLSYAQEYASLIEFFYGIPVDFTNGGTIDIGSGGKLEVGGSIDPGYVLSFGSGSGNTLELDGVVPAAAVGGTIVVGGTTWSCATRPAPASTRRAARCRSRRWPSATWSIPCCPDRCRSPGSAIAASTCTAIPRRAALPRSISLPARSATDCRGATCCCPPITRSTWTAP